MSMFCVKKISVPVRLHEQLRQAREDHRLEIQEAAFRARVPEKYIFAMEQGRYSELPSAGAYRSAYMREYAGLLGLDKQRCLDQLAHELGRYSQSRETEKVSAQKHLHNASLSSLLRTITAIFGAVLLMAYLGLQVKGIINPPQISVVSPAEGSVVQIPAVTIEGKTEAGARLTVNGREITLNTHGEFNSVVDLSPGLNTITISVAKKHGKTTTVTRHVIVKDNKLPEAI